MLRVAQGGAGEVEEDAVECWPRHGHRFDGDAEFFECRGDARKALRVSRYFGDETTEPQVRFSIWHVDSAEAAVSLSPDEAARVAEFLKPPPPPRRVLDQIRESLRL